MTDRTISSRTDTGTAPAPGQPELRLDPEERQRCEIWTRVTGYHRPLSSFNNGKQGEFHERLFFAEPD